MRKLESQPAAPASSALWGALGFPKLALLSWLAGTRPDSSGCEEPLSHLLLELFGLFGFVVVGFPCLCLGFLLLEVNTLVKSTWARIIP